jgi:hypothetical protein
MDPTMSCIVVFSLVDQMETYWMMLENHHIDEVFIIVKWASLL